MTGIDKWSYSSGLSHVSPEEKFAYAAATMLVCVVSRSVLAAGIALAASAFLNVKKGKLPAGRYLRFLMVPLAFLVLSTPAVFVNVSETPMDAYAVAVGHFYITSSRRGILNGMQMILTAMASISCLYVLSLNTPMTEILDVLKKLHVPAVLIELMLLTYRFIFILLEEARAVLTAQKARLGNRDVKTAVRSFGQMASVLFVRALKRSDALYHAMEARCYDGLLKVLGKKYAVSRRRVWVLAGFEALLAAAAVWEKLL